MILLIKKHPQKMYVHMDMEELSLTFTPGICNPTQWIGQSECKIWDDIWVSWFK